ncbi:hypothetical protein [Parafilimonas sp.]|uniref:hypothetical protein n=1 Tax=Parafilimonas sp. TaxID=1969739 RepID=UPI0039E61CD6
MKKFFIPVFSFLAVANGLHAQNNFLVQVSDAGNAKVRVAWTNPYGDSIVQLNIQRSWDSARNYKTIFVPLSPELPQNGYIDETAGYTGMYYRVFYVLANGSYFFTKAQKVKTGSDFTDEISEDKKADTNFLITVHDDDTMIGQFNYNQYRQFRDSIVNYTRDTLYSLTDADILIRYYANNINWMPSPHIFTNSDGYVQISLADASEKNYRLRFFDEFHKPLFSIQHIAQPQLLLDKTDFMHAGWFYFELYENNKVKERNKFYIPKDF